MKRPRSEKKKPEENLLSILGAPHTPPKKKRPPPALAVPLNINVPAVVRLEKGGGGISRNTLTGAVNLVTKGKNATKGRGTVGRAPVVLPHDVSDESEPDPRTPQPDLVADDPVVGADDAVVDNSQFAIKRREEERLIAEERAAPRPVPAPTYHKPVYVDDAWSTTAVRELRRKMLLKKHNGHRPLTTKTLPAFYHRRERNPVVATMKSKTDDDVDIHCQLLTFHADGSFLWPARSPHACWNCCHTFDGPPAMIPRFYNRYHNVYEVYGNFCSWPCAKRHAQSISSEFYYEHAPSLDAFVEKYFGIQGPIAVAPPRFVLDKFSSFGMPIKEYRALGEQCVVGMHFVEPPCVPYEVFVMWQTRSSSNKKIPTGYALDKKNKFESQMRGTVPLPQMPPAIETQPLSSGGKAGKPAAKKQKKNLLSLFA